MKHLSVVAALLGLDFLSAFAVLLIGLGYLNAFAGVAVTIYNQDLALVQEKREVDFPKGTGEVRFVDVAAQIIPTSVHFQAKGVALLEQNYEYDLVSADKLLAKYLDQSVELTVQDGKLFIGTLLSATGDAVIREKDGSVRSLMRANIVNVRFPFLPEGLITRPTLVWMVDADRSGKGNAEISYLTRGMSWEAQYVAVTDAEDKAISLAGWVSITNNSGATYDEAKIKLMAGDVQIEEPERGYQARYALRGYAADAGAPQFKEQEFYEYHLYTLQRPATLRQNQVKQISLFPTAAVPTVKKEYRYDWSEDGNGWSGNRYKAGGGEKKVRVTLSFDNSAANNLGLALPKGKVRVYKDNPEGGQEFVGEDDIDHTPRDEKVRISTGFAFDLVGERTEMNVARQGNERTIQFKVRNRKKEPVTIIVAEHLAGDWTILESTPGWVKQRSDLIEWQVPLKSDEEKVLSYRVLFNR